MLIGAGIIIHNSLIVYKQKIESTPGISVPERRLPPMIVGSIILPANLFWAAWTSQPATPWPARVVAYLFVGAALFIISVQGKYLVDIYLPVTNNPISGNTFLRSFFGAGFPLFSTGMYQNLGVPWATSLLAFISLALAPVPILFFVYVGTAHK